MGKSNSVCGELQLHRSGLQTSSARALSSQFSESKTRPQSRRFNLGFETKSPDVQPDVLHQILTFFIQSLVSHFILDTGFHFDILFSHFIGADDLVCRLTLLHVLIYFIQPQEAKTKIS